MFQCFETPDMGPGIFTFFLFQFVSKRFETIESVDLDISACFNLLQSVYYIIYMFNVSKHQIWGLEFSHFYVSVCFETFRNN